MCPCAENRNAVGGPPSPLLKGTKRTMDPGRGRFLLLLLLLLLLFRCFPSLQFPTKRHHSESLAQFLAGGEASSSSSPEITIISFLSFFPLFLGRARRRPIRSRLIYSLRDGYAPLRTTVLRREEKMRSPIVVVGGRKQGRAENRAAICFLLFLGGSCGIDPFPDFFLWRIRV